nr:hypothetical protein Itr_chr04CG20340 [Ipomoea trifida]
MSVTMAVVRPVRDNAVVRRPQNQRRRGCRRRPLFATPSQSESWRCRTSTTTQPATPSCTVATRNSLSSLRRPTASAGKLMKTKSGDPPR